MNHGHFEFTLIIAEVGQMNDALVDALYEAGCDDGLICHSELEIEIEFARVALTLEQAIESAIANVESTGLKVTRVETSEYNYLHKLNSQLATG